MSELQVAEAAEVLVPLDQREAERLDKRLRLMAGTARDNFEKVGRLLDEAERGRVHEVLGFKSWPAYVSDALGGQLELSKDARQAMVALLSGAGMSERAIAEAVGASQPTVHRDLQVIHDESPESVAERLADGDAQLADKISDAIRNSSAETVTGVDDKTYTKPKPKDPALSALNPRKVVERMAPKVEGLAAAIEVLDPNEVDPDALRAKIGTIRGAVGRITEFIDKVSPPSVLTEAETVRQQPIPSVLRRNMRQIDELLTDLNRLRRSDSRWDKAAERFNSSDRAAVGKALTMLSNIHRALGGDGQPVGDPFEGIAELQDSPADQRATDLSAGASTA